MNLNDMLKLAVSKGASDLHLKVGMFPILRVNGELSPLEDLGRVAPETILTIASQVMSEGQRKVFAEKKEVDLSYGVPGLGRFRVNVFMQRGTMGAVFRVIPMQISKIDDLGLPKIVEKLALEPRGLILVTGTTGSGKSTCLAAMIEHVNTHKTLHVMTIEDPIEFLHRDKKSLINQREIGMDAVTFAAALRSALRQDPDVILVGEMRDFETISTALTAAETGHLVMSTLHTIDASETINRIIAVFPPYQQKQVRMQLASVIRGIVSLRLVPRADGRGRVPAVEVMVSTATIRDCIMDSEKTIRIPETIAAGATQYGMQTFDQSLYKLYSQGLITYEEALRRCSNPDDFALRVQGIQSASDIGWQGQEKPSGKDPHEKPPSGREPPIERFGR
ncbi:MAG: type IV pilus twitching motility protein PilT [Nitrospirae bacterium]|nr:type IV pilus twitching motility protein PilT [Nitrospirota bacterium]